MHWLLVGDQTLYPQKTESAIMIMQSEVSVAEGTNFKSDERILAITSRTLVAAEADYYKSCYLECTRQSQE